jgi:hypothetical protein
MADKFMYSGNWHIRLPDSLSLNLNSEEGADYVLGLLEHVGELEAQLRKREQKRARMKREEVEDGD